MRLIKGKEEEALREYAKLHDALSDMIEEGRLREGDIPDDYQWLADTLQTLGGYWEEEPAKIITDI